MHVLIQQTFQGENFHGFHIFANHERLSLKNFLKVIESPHFIMWNMV